MLRIKRPNLLQNKTIISSMVLVLGFAGTAGALQLLPSDSGESQVSSSRTEQQVERANVEREEKQEKSEPRKDSTEKDTTGWASQQPQQSTTGSQTSNGQATTAAAPSGSTQSNNESSNRPASGQGNVTPTTKEPKQEPAPATEPCDESLLDCVTDILQ